MAHSNQTLMAKADMQVADLITDGGYLREEQADMFIRDLIEESIMMKMVDVRTTKSHTQLLDNIGIDGRVLRPGTSGTALAEADRVKPETDQTTLETKLLKAEIHLTEELLEDNIEGGAFKTTIMSMMAEHISYDMDDLLVNGDTASADTFYATLDGMRKSATSNLVNAGGNPLAPSYLLSALKSMPSKYNRNKGNHKFFTSEKAEMDLRDDYSDRMTALGDRNLTSEVPMIYQNRQVVPVPAFPDDLGVGSDETECLLLDPKNARWGIWRKVKIDTDKDIRAGVWIMVATVRAGFAYKKEEAVVKIHTIQN